MPDTRPSSHLGLYRAGITGSEHRRSITVGRDSLFQDTIEILRKCIGKKTQASLSVYWAARNRQDAFIVSDRRRDSW